MRDATLYPESKALPLSNKLAVRFMATLLAFSLMLSLMPSAEASSGMTEYDVLRAKWHTYLTGGDAYDPLDPDIAANLAAKSRSVSNPESTGIWDTMNKQPGRTYLWSDLQSTTASDQVSTHFSRLKQMALVYATRGSALYHNEQLKQDIISALDWAYANRYNENKTETGNWWDWEIGTPQLVNDTLVLMYDHLTPSQIDQYMRAIDRFVPNPSKRTINGVTETGANLLDKSFVVALRGIIGQSSTKITQGRDAMGPAFLYVKTGDGFYEDGSFIQHTNIAYTGGYGAVLIGRIADMFYLLKDSSWNITDPNAMNVFRWVREGFEPLIYKGAIMDNLRGRGISRQNTNDHTSGRGIVLAILRLSEGAPAAEALHIKRMVKEWIGTDTTFVNYFTGAGMFEMILGKNLMNDASIIPRGDLIGHYAFPSMDRVAHYGDQFGFGISMFSPRISSFEYGNGENIKGWHTGVGMTTLYNSDLQQFSGNYWATADMYRLPGTTTDGSGSGTPVAWKSYMNPMSWVGGSAIDQLYGSVGMQFSNAQNTGSTLQGKKSWFLFGNRVTALGTGIKSTDNRQVETIVENRKLNEAGNNVLTVNGAVQPASLGWSQKLDGVSWAHLAGAVPGADIGYYFPNAPSLNMKREARAGSWQQVNTGGASASVTDPYLSLAFDHGKSPTDGSYAYVLLPNQSAASTAGYAANPTVQVLAQNDDVHAIFDTEHAVLGANFWKDEQKAVSMNGAPILSSDKKASVTMKESNGELHIGVSDPTQLNNGEIHLEIHKPAGSVLALDPSITVTQLAPTIKLTVRTSATYGVAQTVKLSMGNPTVPEAPVLTQAEPSGSNIALTWTHSAGASGYRVSYGTASGSYTEMIEASAVSQENKLTVTGLAPGQVYYFTVKAYNAAGESAASNERSATPALAAVLDPTHDAYVRDGTYAAQNFGTQTSLVVKNDGSGYARQSYLKFDLSQLLGTVQSAKLRLTSVGTGTTGINHQVLLVESDTWTESTLTWNNKPAGSTVLGTFVAPASGTSVEVDLTSQVIASLTGDKQLSLVVISPVNAGSKGDVSYASKEHATAASRPALEIQFQAAP